MTDFDREAMLTRAAEAMFEAHTPEAHRLRARGRWSDIALRMYRARFNTGLNAVEADIRTDERRKIAEWLRSLKSRHRIINIELAAETIQKGKYDVRPVE